jgi:hypothetical protein
MIVFMDTDGGGGSPPTSTKWNPLDMVSGVVLSNGDLNAVRSSGSGWGSLRATQGKSTGDRYFTVTVVQTTGGYVMIGVANANASLAKHLGQDAAAIMSAGVWSSGTLWYRLSVSQGSTPSTSYSNGAVIGVRVNFSTLTVTFYDDATGVSLASKIDTGSWTLPFYPAASLWPAGGSISNLNCGGPFGNLPAGASAWDS